MFITYKISQTIISPFNYKYVPSGASTEPVYYSSVQEMSFKCRRFSKRFISSHLMKTLCTNWYKNYDVHRRVILNSLLLGQHKTPQNTEVINSNDHYISNQKALIGSSLSCALQWVPLPLSETRLLPTESRMSKYFDHFT